MTFEVILDFLNSLRLHNVSIHRDFEQNQFINECARKKKAKIPESRSPRSFLMRYRRTYVLNNNYFFRSPRMRWKKEILKDGFRADQRNISCPYNNTSKIDR